MTRLYSPQDFGVLGAFMAMATLLGIIVSSQYNSAIILKSDDNEASQLVFISIGLNALVCVALFLPIFLLGDPILAFFKLQNYQSWVFAVPLLVFLSGLNSVLSIWSNRLKLYGRLTRSRLYQSCCSVVVQLGFAFAVRGETGLIVGFIAGTLLSSLYLFFSISSQDRERLHHFDWGGVLRAQGANRSIALYSLPTDLINTFLSQAPVLLLTRFSTVSVVGNYNLCQRILGLPLTFIGSSVAEIFRQRASEEYFKVGHCKAVFLETLRLLIRFAAPPFALILLFGPIAFSVVFGNKWVLAGDFSRILSVMFFLKFLASPLSYVFYVYNRQKEALFLHVLTLLGTGSLFSLVYWLDAGPVWLIAAFSFSFSLIYAVYLWRSFEFVSSHERS